MNLLLEKLIGLIVEEEAYKTKANKKIEFKVHEQSPNKVDNLGRGWIVHLIEAFIDNEQVGYIKLSYIPESKLQEEYPTIVHYLDKINGKAFHVDRETDEKIRSSGKRPVDEFLNLPLTKQVRGLDNYRYNSLFYPPEKTKQPEDMSKEELLKIKNEIMNHMQQEYGKMFQEFKAYHVNKPLVDYIMVFDQHRRQGIAIALYEYAAKWLAKKGMKLYASGIQSDEAKKAWEWLRNNHSANIGIEKPKRNATGGYKKVRTFLSYL